MNRLNYHIYLYNANISLLFSSVWHVMDNVKREHVEFPVQNNKIRLNYRNKVPKTSKEKMKHDSKVVHWYRNPENVHLVQ